MARCSSVVMQGGHVSLAGVRYVGRSGQRWLPTMSVAKVVESEAVRQDCAHQAGRSVSARQRSDEHDVPCEFAANVEFAATRMRDRAEVGVCGWPWHSCLLKAPAEESGARWAARSSQYGESWSSARRSHEDPGAMPRGSSFVDKKVDPEGVEPNGGDISALA